jgi:protocatechuate 3,4-dioxygenase, beta subunit
VPEPARPRLVARFDLPSTEPGWALAFQWDIVLQGRQATPLESPSS